MLAGSARTLVADRAGPRHLHAGARHQHRQRRDSDHRRQSRRSRPIEGTWVITSFAVSNGIAVPADRLADAALRRGAHLRALGAALHGGLVSVRICLESVLAGGVPRAAGRGIGADDSGLAGAAAEHLSAAEARHGARHLVDDHAGRADRRAGARRLHLRQLELAVDLLHQRAGRGAVARCCAGAIWRSATRRRGGCRSIRWAWACWSSGSVRCRSCSTRARTWTGSPRRPSWCSPSIAVVGFLSWLIWELTDAHPIVDLSLFKLRSFSSARSPSVWAMRCSSAMSC